MARAALMAPLTSNRLPPKSPPRLPLRVPRPCSAASAASTVSPSLTNPSPALTTLRPVLPILPPGLPRLSVADHQAVKISVAQEGWYHVSFAQLFAAGLDRYTDSRTLHLYAEGVEQPLLLTGRASGPPSPSDAIEFYGTGIDTPFSADRVYWLISDSHWPKRILPVAAACFRQHRPGEFSIHRSSRGSHHLLRRSAEWREQRQFLWRCHHIGSDRSGSCRRAHRSFFAAASFPWTSLFKAPPTRRSIASPFSSMEPLSAKWTSSV